MHHSVALEDELVESIVTTRKPDLTHVERECLAEPSNRLISEHIECLENAEYRFHIYYLVN